MNTLIKGIEKPSNVGNISEKEMILRGFQKAVQLMTAMPESEEKHSARRRLLCGSTKRSRVEGVNTVTAVTKFIGDLGDVQALVQHPETKEPLFRFLVPEWYKAYSAYVRMKDLELEKREPTFAMGVHPCPLWERTANGMECKYVWHAPHISPIRCETVIFILDKTWSTLVEWFVGEEPALWTQTGDPRTHWVHLGVDKLEEQKRNQKKTFYASHQHTTKPRSQQAVSTATIEA